ncbi:MAG: hypothetical protein WA876_02960 [Candidatus Acidiferrales bacterium]
MSSAIHISERQWHDPAFVSSRVRARNLRLARARRKETEIVISDAEQRALDARYDRAHPKPKGNPERAIPKAFDGNGDWLPHLASRIPAHQSEQARLLLENGLKGKARRQAWCGLLARPMDCIENPQHKFFRRCRCFNRYCPNCGPLCFRELFAKHSRLAVVVEQLMQHSPADHRPRVLAKLDVTTKTLGRMQTREEVHEFNRDVRKLFRAIEKRFGISRKEYGALWCCEFGRMNQNLHAHAVYCGPWIPQKELSLLWSEIRSDGSFIVSIKQAKSFEAALSHALKYPSKFFDAPATRLVDLELAFDRVRRVHAVAAFYNPKIEREAGEDEKLLNGTCPICRGLLGEPFRAKRGWNFADELEREGRQDIEKIRASANVRSAEFESRITVALGAGP